MTSATAPAALLRRAASSSLRAALVACATWAAAGCSGPAASAPPPAATMAGAAGTPAPNGDWKGPGGVIRVEPCAAAQTLCVAVVSGSEDKNSMADIVGTTVVKDMVSAGPGRWRGRYVADGKDLAATITLKNPNLAEMRVCLLSWFPYLLCETPSYSRIVP